VIRGTAFVGDPRTDALDKHRTPPRDTPQFTAAGFDSGFLFGCSRALSVSGRNSVTVIPSTKKKFHGPVGPAIHLYVCSEALCHELAALTEERATELAERWHVPDARIVYHDSASRRPEHIVAVLRALASVARDADAVGKWIMVRVDYRLVD
jgi:hypothetical protein